MTGKPFETAHRPNINYGCTILNDSPCLMKTTIVATGAGRSGTTMLSRVMSAIGVDLGKNLTPETREDKGLQVAVKSGDVAAFEQICRQYDVRRKKWGFKCPPIRSRLLTFNPLMRNPRYIVIFRDLLAVGLRNNMAIGGDLLSAMHESALSYAATIAQLQQLQQPALLISYEKALQYPQRTVSVIAGFCGQPLTDDRIAEIAAETITASDPRYLAK